MNRSHLLPATLLALAAVAIAQSTQNQSNIARLVNVINQVTAKVDGVIPLREHVTIIFETSYSDGSGPVPPFVYTVPDGFCAQVRSVIMDTSDSGGFGAILTVDGQSVALKGPQDFFGNEYGDYLRGMTLPPGADLAIWANHPVAAPRKGVMTVVLEEI